MNTQPSTARHLLLQSKEKSQMFYFPPHFLKLTMLRKLGIGLLRCVELSRAPALGRSISYILLTAALVACGEYNNLNVVIPGINTATFEPSNVAVEPADGYIRLQWVNPANPDVTIKSVNITVQSYANGIRDISINPAIDQENRLEDYAGNIASQDYSHIPDNDTLYYSFKMAFIASNGEVYEPKANLDIASRRDPLDRDYDKDGVPNQADACLRGISGWTSNKITDYDGDGCYDFSDEDNDNDNDLVIDIDDSCRLGLLGWQSSSSTDHDRDGCWDFSSEEQDADNDLVLDNADDCPLGLLGWQSSSITDYDRDGCQDFSTEDNDADNDLLTDDLDGCDFSARGWQSNSSNDYDGDGCQDHSTEDNDDDNDLVLDNKDSCPRGALGWQNNGSDHDGDGCLDFSAEDQDADNDLVLDTDDSCPLGLLNWQSSSSTDYDSDGCQDFSIEDNDADNDQVSDDLDICARGIKGWQSNSSSDYDGDGCQDSSIEETDTDNDLVLNIADSCPLGLLNWQSNKSTDYNGNGCQDFSSEDNDADNDLVLDDVDSCPLGLLGRQSNSSSDYDGDGCQDSNIEDADDDNDSVLDNLDSCPLSIKFGSQIWQSNSSSDYDGDGCQDSSIEDADDDNDSVLDNLDSCPLSIKFGSQIWQSNSSSDYDSDGCQDFSSEDNDADNDSVLDNLDSCPLSMKFGPQIWQSNSSSDIDGDGCQDFSIDDNDADNDGVPDDKDDYPLDGTRKGDGDGVVGADDIDGDGDGLIEIATADELNLVRADLTGSSLNGNKSGCGDGVNITSCTGYELVADIDLALMDWRPIAPCITPTSNNICLGTETFRGHFEGNGHTISNVQVLTDVDDRGIGFFGATNGAQLRNINIKGLTIKFNDNIVASVGGLVGQAAGQTSIINSSVKGDISITGDGSAIDRVGVGGLVGRCVDVVIKNSASLMGTVVASADSVGGLVGFCATSQIDGSYGHTLSIANNRVSGVKYLGGFIGRAEGATIKNSYSYAHRIRASYTASPLNGVGGFIGSADQDTSADQATRIVNTYAVSSVIVVPSLSASSNQFGGFAGEFKGSSFETSSYWDNSVTDFLAYRSKVASNSLASGKGTLELVRTAELSGSIYDNWGQFWCNPTTFDIVQQLTQPAGYIALWDLGSTSEYPVLNCTPLNVAEQRIFFADIQINDLDKDGLFNAEDIDDDGDGLIEISNATALDAVRESVRGNSLAGITAGCGNSIDIFDCNGYELTADIDLSAFSSWEPIAGCERKDVNDNCIMPSSFISKFDGNGHTISNLRLNTPTLLAKQLGLFASVAYTDIRNVHIENPQMYVSGSTYNEVGILAGYVLSSTISNISISGDTLTSIGDHRTLTSHVGGMIGYCEEAVIKTASVRLASMTVHANDVGGLAGRCQNSQISGAFTQIGSIKTFLKDQTNHAYVGGLVGALEGADSLVDASYSHTQVIEIPAPQNGGEAGGLIGQISDSGARVSHSYAVAKKIIVGRQGSAIEAGRSLSAAGGLVASTVTSVSDSFWDSSVLAYSVNPSTLLNQPSGVGVAKSSIELRLPVDFVGSLYDNWKDLWCNPLTSDIQTSVPAPGNDWVRLWDLGSNSDYPVMNCANAKKSAQRVALNNIKIGRSLFDLPVDSGTIIDTDADGVADLEDVDADGDGLIEIATATEFNDMREDSYGRSLSGNSNGCGNDFNAFVCKGYELVSDIDLASFSSWDPLAGCTARDVSGCSNFIAFGGDLQGNGHTISNLRIDSSTSHYHIGLFAATTGSNIENLQIES
ncbi:MAG: thrombospondin type 3 repeat-containing protein, partial [Gammaproteobacteria bacterium]|nr:thrombospondin type 3 repeat-containing protein [Gammaproteobacteria bacterium]